MILSNDGLVAFHYRSYGTFFLQQIGSIISIGDLPTTNIIEPFFDNKMNLVIFWISKLFLQKYNKSYKQYIMYRKGLHIRK